MIRKATILLLALLGPLVLATPPSTAAQEVEFSIEAKAAGGLFREVARPVAASLHIRVSPPADVATVTPMINSRVIFPAEMSFNPDPAVTPVCPKSVVGPTTNLGLGIARLVALCPDSVIGTGTAGIYLFQQKSFRLGDPQVVIFNAGRTRAGDPRIRLYSFSKAAGAGLLMEGSLDRKGRLNIPIGVLPYDSAISDMTLGIPGEPIEVEDEQSPTGKSTVVGLDRRYLRAVCDDGMWEARGRFSFATRDEATGTLTSPVSLADAIAPSLVCKGRRGKARLAPLRVSGKRTFRPGGKRTFRVLVRNRGTAVARGLTVKVSGGGRGHAQSRNVAPGRKRSVPVKVRFFRSGKTRRTLNVMVRGQGTKRVVRVRVRTAL